MWLLLQRTDKLHQIFAVVVLAFTECPEGVTLVEAQETAMILRFYEHDRTANSVLRLPENFKRSEEQFLTFDPLVRPVSVILPQLSDKIRRNIVDVRLTVKTTRTFKPLAHRLADALRRNFERTDSEREVPQKCLIFIRKHKMRY